MSQTHAIRRVRFEPVDEIVVDHDYALVVDQTVRAVFNWTGSRWTEGEEDKGDTLYYAGWALSIDELGVLPQTVPHDESPKGTSLTEGYLIDFGALAAASHGIHQLDDLQSGHTYLYQENEDFAGPLPRLQWKTVYPYFYDEEALPPLISSAEVIGLLNAPDVLHLTDSRGFEEMSLKEVGAASNKPDSRWITWDVCEVYRNRQL